jgi:hypothetical protein
VLIASPLNGGAGFAGKSGRKIANVCDANATKANMNSAAHFMPAPLSKIEGHGKQNFCAITVITTNRVSPFESMNEKPEEDFSFKFAILRFRLIFHADATVCIPCPRCAGQPG